MAHQIVTAHPVISSSSPILAQVETAYRTTFNSALHLSAEMLVGIGFVAALTAYIFWRGKDEGILNLLALIVAGFVFSTLTYLSGFPDTAQTSSIKALVFAVLFMIIRFAFSALIAPAYPRSSITRFFGAFFLAIATAGLLAIFAERFIGIEKLYTFSPPLMHLLGAPNALFWALAVSLLIIGILA